MMEKVRSIAMITSVMCSVVVYIDVRPGADYKEHPGN